MNKIVTVEVALTISGLIKDLSEGLTWQKKDDAGYGSIQEKYAIPDEKLTQIMDIPQLREIPTTIRVFKIIDDTKKTEDKPKTVNNGSSVNASTPASTAPAASPAKPRETTESNRPTAEPVGVGIVSPKVGSTEEVDAFFGL